MAGVNRFYQPSRSQYISQFVPDELPAELMIAGLGKKQQKYDTMAATIAQLGEWSQRALPGYDTKYVDQKKQSLQDFINNSLNRDLSSPEYIREYQKFVGDFKNDKGLQAVTASVATHDQYMERVKKLKEGSGSDYDRAFVENYERHFNTYTADEGLGYTGDVQLSDPTIFAGVDLNKEMEAYFDQIHASGSDSVKFLANGLSYKNGWTGISGDKIKDQTSRIFDTFYDSRAGQQLQARFEADHIPMDTTYEQFYQSLNEEDRINFENAKRTYVGNQLLNTGMGFTYGISDTNIDQAYNTKAGWDREDMQLYPQNPNIQVQGNTLSWKTPNYSEAMQLFNSNQSALTKNQKTLSTYETLLQYVNSGKQIPKDEFGKPIIDNETKALLNGVPGGKEFLNGAPMSKETQAYFVTELNNKIADQKHTIDGINLQQKQMEFQMREAIQGVDPTRTFGSMDVNFSDAIQLGEDLIKQNPNMKWAYDLIGSTIVKEDREGFDEFMGTLMLGRDNIKKAYLNGEMTKEESVQALNEFDILETWGEAKFYQKSVQNDPRLKGAIVSNFNQEGTYQPVATTMPLTDNYMQYTQGPNGEVIKLGTAQRADVYMENLARTSPNTFTVMIGNQRVTPGHPLYPKADTIEFGSANTELVNGKPVFNGIASYTKIVPVLNADGEPVVNPDGSQKTREEVITQNYTFIAEGVSADSYMAAKKNEAYSNVLVDQGYKPGVPLQFQDGLSDTGQASLRNYISYSDPALATNVANVQNLNAGSNTAFRRPVYNPFTGDVDYATYQVKKDQATGDYIILVTDSQGRNMNPGAGTIRMETSGQVGTWIADWEYEMNADGDRGVKYDHPSGTTTNTTTTPVISGEVKSNEPTNTFTNIVTNPLGTIWGN